MAAPDDAELKALASAVSERLMAAGRTLVTAESCTGGWIAKACTDLPGSSRWFLGGVVCYANAAKTRLLGIDAALIQAHGAVSEPVVRAMAGNALDRLG
ncbi:MAG TPA: CinA family protein, partial [Steroidobacteraceae bacterium]|nr:CinA family protein [Steroidobacteraceae bacterium]